MSYTPIWIAFYIFLSEQFHDTIDLLSFTGQVETGKESPERGRERGEREREREERERQRERRGERERERERSRRD